MKRTPLPRRQKPIQVDPEKVRAWQRRSRKPIPQVSARRLAERPEREAVRVEVLRRDGGCRGRGILPGRCGSPWRGRPPLEVHEVVSRGRWASGYLVAANCLTLCQVHHDWVTTHPTEATEAGFSASLSTGVDGMPKDR